MRNEPAFTMSRRVLGRAAMVGALVLAGCGGGGGAGDAATVVGTSSSAAGGSGAAGSASSTGATASATPATATPSTAAMASAGFAPASDEEAARFLAQATFGPKSLDEIATLRRIGYDAWFEDQFRKASSSYDAWMSRHAKGNGNDNISAFYTGAVKGEDQLRQRMTWALSQIFVVSDRTGPLSLQPSVGVNAYLDVLRTNAFGTYRQLLDGVTYNAVMAVYLTYLGNEREDYTAPGSIPDNNYAREIMQLFSIGLWQLNPDGTRKLSNGAPIPTYGNDDIFGLSKVFTGFTYASSSDRDTIAAGTGLSRDNAFRERMGFDKNRHSSSEKRFLGRTIAATSSPQPIADVRTALDILAAHPNVGPFIGRQLIQRFTTSNPSPAYVERISRVFDDNGQGVRGDLKAVVKAILLDPEARDRGKLADPTWGKAREPVLAVSQWMRLLNATNAEGVVEMWRSAPNCFFDTGRLIYLRHQAPAYATTVFGFYRPNFSPPGSELAARGLEAPELQIVDTASIAEWSNFVVNTFVRDGTGGARDCSIAANRFDYAGLSDLAATPSALVDRLVLLLMAGNLSSDRRAALVSAVERATGRDATTLRRNRIRLAMTFIALSPEYLVQK